jgi:organic radical activating enzyme
MHCKFIKNGLSISYDQVIKPCCAWKISPEWQDQHHITNTSVINWHQQKDVLSHAYQLENNQWPNACQNCKDAETNNHTSTRLQGNSAYENYADNDITLEIRPGNTCNFACQTCWPEASSRVANYYHQAGIINIKNLNSEKIRNFDFLLPIAHNIKDVVLLGGEPFYDKSSLSFLNWAANHLHANLTMFTNGSVIDFDFLKNYVGKINLVFSIDAVGRDAEYVRVGTDWKVIQSNFQQAKEFATVRANVTCSVYNYHLLDSVIEFLLKDWPDLVLFGFPWETKFQETVIPIELRSDVIQQLQMAAKRIMQSTIDQQQKTHAVKCLKSIIKNLQTKPWDAQHHSDFCQHVIAMDSVKNLSVRDYSSTLLKILDHKPN